MPISQECVDFLFDVLRFYDNQYDKVVDNCFNDVKRALDEICADYLKSQKAKIVPTGAYAIKNTYQVLEPMEFLCVLPAERDSVLAKEAMQKKNSTKKKNTIKDIYNNILGGNSNADMTAIDVAGTIMREMQKYIGEEDKLYFKHNVVFLKFHMSSEIEISVIIYVVYEFENQGVYEYSKLGYKTRENTAKLIRNLQEKNARTNGNFLLFCKLCFCTKFSIKYSFSDS